MKPDLLSADKVIITAAITGVFTTVRLTRPCRSHRSNKLSMLSTVTMRALRSFIFMPETMKGKVQEM